MYNKINNKLIIKLGFIYFLKLYNLIIYLI